MVKKLINTVNVRKRVDDRKGGNGGHPLATRLLTKLLERIDELDKGTGHFDGGTNYRQKYNSLTKKSTQGEMTDVEY